MGSVKEPWVLSNTTQICPQYSSPNASSQSEFAWRTLHASRVEIECMSRQKTAECCPSLSNVTTIKSPFAYQNQSLTNLTSLSKAAWAAPPCVFLESR